MVEHGPLAAARSGPFRGRRTDYKYAQTGVGIFVSLREGL